MLSLRPHSLMVWPVGRLLLLLLPLWCYAPAVLLSVLLPWSVTVCCELVLWVAQLLADSHVAFASVSWQ